MHCFFFFHLSSSGGQSDRLDLDMHGKVLKVDHKSQNYRTILLSSYHINNSNESYMGNSAEDSLCSFFQFLFDVSFPFVGFSIELTSHCLHTLSMVPAPPTCLVSILASPLLGHYSSFSSLF